MDRVRPSPRDAIGLALVLAAAWAHGEYARARVEYAFLRFSFPGMVDLEGMASAAREGLLVGAAAVVALLRRPRVSAGRALAECLLLAIVVFYASAFLALGQSAVLVELGQRKPWAPGGLERVMAFYAKQPLTAPFWLNVLAYGLGFLSFATARHGGRLDGFLLVGPFAVLMIVRAVWITLDIAAETPVDEFTPPFRYTWHHAFKHVMPFLFEVVVVTAAVPLLPVGLQRLRERWNARAT